MSGVDKDALGDQKQDAELVENLFREHHHVLVRLIAAKIGSIESAKEIAQEAYMKFLNISDSASLRSHKAYLFRIAANLATDHLRHAAIVRNHERSSQYDEHSDSLDPLRFTAANQELQLLRHILTELPDNCRVAFKLFHFEGMPLSDISERLDVSERMVRNYLSKALTHCQSRLDELHGG